MEKGNIYQTDDIKWLPSKKKWKGIKSTGMDKKIIEDEKGVCEEYPHCISRLK